LPKFYPNPIKSSLLRVSLLSNCINQANIGINDCIVSINGERVSINGNRININGEHVGIDD